VDLSSTSKILPQQPADHSSACKQTPSGTTYFTDQPAHRAHPLRVCLPRRRPTIIKKGRFPCFCARCTPSSPLFGFRLRSNTAAVLLRSPVCFMALNDVPSFVFYRRHCFFCRLAPFRQLTVPLCGMIPPAWSHRLPSYSPPRCAAPRHSGWLDVVDEVSPACATRYTVT